jgi:hypothetical protein
MIIHHSKEKILEREGYGLMQTDKFLCWPLLHNALYNSTASLLTGEPTEFMMSLDMLKEETELQLSP